METPSHARLKQLSAVFLLMCGCRAVASEVRCPGSKYVLDTAGYLDPLPKRARPRGGEPWGGDGGAALLRRGERPKTVIVECKQSRGDFLRDTRETRRLLAERERLDVERVRLEEERIKVNEPELRQSGSFLFTQMEAWEFTASRLATYRRVLAGLRRVDQRLYGQTKLWMIARYRLADCLYVAAPAGMVRARELPRGWGLLECGGRLWRQGEMGHEEPPLRIAVRCGEEAGAAKHQSRLLRNIAVAATRESMRGLWARLGGYEWHRERAAPTRPWWE